MSHPHFYKLINFRYSRLYPIIVITKAGLYKVFKTLYMVSLNGFTNNQNLIFHDIFSYT